MEQRIAGSEADIEQEIQEKGLNAPRLTPADIDAAIVSETFTVLPSGKAMVCELTLRNGFTVRGESACVSKENFDTELGQKISRQNARNKVRILEGYLLQERVYIAEMELDSSVYNNSRTEDYCRNVGQENSIEAKYLLTQEQARIVCQATKSALGAINASAGNKNSPTEEIRMFCLREAIVVGGIEVKIAAAKQLEHYVMTGEVPEKAV